MNRVQVLHFTNILFPPGTHLLYSCPDLSYPESLLRGAVPRLFSTINIFPMMALQRRFLPLLAIASALLFFFLYHSTSVRETWRGLPQAVGMGEALSDQQPTTENSDGEGTPKSEEETNYANWNPRPIFKGGNQKPSDYNFTSILVIPRTKEEDVNWIKEELPNQQTAIYVADDPSAPLHPPKNKGHEVMIYLSWIIENYDDLPDVAIFMHAHRWSWHNDDILDNDAAMMIRRLSLNRVWREGYMNMRCSWDPGCPDWMHPGEVEEDMFKQEQSLLAKSWSELFPLDEVPSVLAQPCCAQFALSSERIQARPLSSYVWYRDWLLHTPLSDYISGRIWEYVWQFVFTGNNIFCPKEHTCFCDGFGVCFGGEDQFNEFISVRQQMQGKEGELREWEDKGKAIEEAKDEGRFEEAQQLDVPEPGKDKELKEQIETLREDVNKRKKEAFERGMNPANRAMEAGRQWHEGDGY